MDEDLEEEVALFSVGVDNAADKPASVEDEAHSNVLVAVVGSNTTISVVAEVEEEDAVLAGEMTSPSAIVMRQFRSSLSGQSWRRLTSLAWVS